MLAATLLILSALTWLKTFARSGNSTEVLITSDSQFRAPRQNYIQFAAADIATLYINGKKKLTTSNANLFAYISVSLKREDVVAVEVSSKGGFYGFIGEVSVDFRPFVTGRDNWLAAKASTVKGTGWRLNTYPPSQICRWRRAEVLPKAAEWPKGKATFYNNPTAARYVWANNAGAKDKIYLRLKIGPENCGIFSDIYFAADSQATLYVNGQLKGAIADPTKFSKVVVKLAKGDVVAVKAKGSGKGFGVVIAIKTGGWYATGKEEWRAVKAFQIYGEANGWQNRFYGACRWPKPVLASTVGGSPVRAPKFPYGLSGAQYVWANNAGKNDNIFIRTVIGVQC